MEAELFSFFEEMKGCVELLINFSIPLERLYFAHLLASSFPRDSFPSRSLPSGQDVFLLRLLRLFVPQFVGSSSDSPKVEVISSSSGDISLGDVKVF
ncbi:hypothetical protein B296_00009194 [Ensete ventricosum]|uniref:Uncharacterized protein n=1 Tax=Ensete ventricosum TaxID=4639 RepID=A0A426YS28_ENSVE|nr:hypothetical protein B296_00009194 [Ensete ventricosum]